MIRNEHRSLDYDYVEQLGVDEHRLGTTVAWEVEEEELLGALQDPYPSSYYLIPFWSLPVSRALVLNPERPSYQRNVCVNEYE